MMSNNFFGKKFTYDPTAVVCCCFGYTPADIAQDLEKNGRSIILERIAAEKKRSACQRAAKNPTGR